ncbi:protein takeout-like [Spodoptera frugiperda]|uniref:Protein takeout-like n=1 Tax=Spodoptera frugiperda TaxID=7108 RepID=A0A9R0DFA5_SPOFR|nr:protein takeout-like [Spodoptera frugiperda]
MFHIIIAIIFSVFISVQSVPTPTFQQCKKTDVTCLNGNINTIFQKSIKGDQDLGIKSVDPMHHKEIDGQLSVIEYQLYNSTVEGFSKCEVVNTKLDLEKRELNFRVLCPVLVMYGVYNISGTLIVMPIEGHGDYKIVCKGYDMQVETDIMIQQDNNGMKHISIKYFKADGELTEGMTTDLQNLFGGKQPQLAKDVLKFVNENWGPVAKVLQGPVFGANYGKIVKNINKVLKHVPLNQIIEE